VGINNNYLLLKLIAQLKDLKEQLTDLKKYIIGIYESARRNLENKNNLKFKKIVIKQ